MKAAAASVMRIWQAEVGEPKREKLVEILETVFRNDPSLNLTEFLEGKEGTNVVSGQRNFQAYLGVTVCVIAISRLMCVAAFTFRKNIPKLCSQREKDSNKTGKGDFLFSFVGN